MGPKNHNLTWPVRDLRWHPEPGILVFGASLLRRHTPTSDQRDDGLHHAANSSQNHSANSRKQTCKIFLSNLGYVNTVGI